MDIAKTVKKLLKSSVKYVSDHAADFATTPSYFTRHRQWTIDKILNILLQWDSGNLTDAIYNALPKKDKAKSFTISGFIQQRDHIKAEAGEFIFKRILKSIRKKTKPKTYWGYYLVSCDGSDIRTPTEVTPSEPDADIQRKVQHTMLHLNALYDVTNQLYVSVSMEPKVECNERRSLLNLLKDNIGYPPKKTSIICDRGYESSDVFTKLILAGYNFVIRVKKPNGGGILHNIPVPAQENKSTFEQDITIRVRLGRKGTYRKTSARELPIDITLSLRVVIQTNDKNESIYLITNVPRKKLCAGQIVQVYRKRWDIEVSFRHLKYSVGGLVFHAKNLNAQKLELYTALTLYNCVSTIVHQVNIPSVQKVNFSVSVKKCLVYLFENIPIDLMEQLAHNLIAIKYDRHFERKISHKPLIAFIYRIR